MSEPTVARPIGHFDQNSVVARISDQNDEMQIPARIKIRLKVCC